MALGHNPTILSNGIFLNYDAANTKSYSGTGTLWTSIAGVAIPGTLTNGPTFSSSNGGNIILDGVNDYIDLGSSTLIYNNLTTNRITMNLWAKSTGTTGGGQRIFFDSGSLEYIQCDLFTDLPGFLVSTATSGYVRARATSTMTVGTWFNITGVYDGSNVIMYINGKFEQQTAATGNLSTQSSDYAAIGRQPTSGYYAYASIAYFSLYNRALSATEVLNNFVALRGRFGV